MLTMLSALNYLTMENGTENPKQKENQGVKTDLEVVTFTYVANSPRGKKEKESEKLKLLKELIFNNLFFKLQLLKIIIK